MATERTLSIIKPDAVGKNQIGEIIRRIEQRGLSIVAAKMIRLNHDQASEFYNVHRKRPFFDELIEFICSGPLLVQVLEGENAIAVYREIMGTTDPAKAAPGTIRGDLAGGMPDNAVHGSDAPETAAQEIALFFSADEIHARSG